MAAAASPKALAVVLSTGHRWSPCSVGREVELPRSSTPRLTSATVVPWAKAWARSRASASGGAILSWATTMPVACETRSRAAQSWSVVLGRVHPAEHGDPDGVGEELRVLAAAGEPALVGLVGAEHAQHLRVGPHREGVQEHRRRGRSSAWLSIGQRATCSEWESPQTGVRVRNASRLGPSRNVSWLSSARSARVSVAHRVARSGALKPMVIAAPWASTISVNARHRRSGSGDWAGVDGEDPGELAEEYRSILHGASPPWPTRERGSALSSYAEGRGPSPTPALRGYQRGSSAAVRTTRPGP